MSDIFEFVKNLYSQQINSQFRSEDPNNKIWYRNIKNMSQMNIMNENENLFKKKKKMKTFSQMNIKLSSSFSTLRLK